MSSNGKNPIVIAIGTAVVAFAASLLFDFVKDVLIDGGVFAPNWFEIILFTIACGVIGYFAPDAAQRKRNRENLRDSFKR